MSDYRQPQPCPVEGEAGPRWFGFGHAPAGQSAEGRQFTPVSQAGGVVRAAEESGEGCKRLLTVFLCADRP